MAQSTAQKPPSNSQPDRQAATLPLPAGDVGPTSQPAQLASVMRPLSDLTDTPPNPRSVESTAPSSPRL